MSKKIDELKKAFENLAIEEKLKKLKELSPFAKKKEKKWILPLTFVGGFLFFLKKKVMAIIKELIEGTKIIVDIESSNLKRAQYDTESKLLEVEFKTGAIYEYEEVPHTIFTRMRMSESQGKYFNTEISRKFKYKKKS